MTNVSPDDPQTRARAKQERAAEKARRALERLAGVQGASGDPVDATLLNTIAALQQEVAELKASYYLSGAHKKIDIRAEVPFGEIALAVQAEGRAGMQLDRMYTLWQGVTGAPEGPMAEVGAYKGGSSRLMGESLRRAGRAPQFYVCDTFEGHARVDPVLDTVHNDNRKFRDTSAESVREYLRQFPFMEVVPGDIHETATRFDGIPGWAFIHVDVDVYPATDFCLRYFAPRLLPGAWLVIDDYGFTTCPGAKKAADDFVAEFPEFRMLHLLSGQAIVFKRG